MINMSHDTYYGRAQVLRHNYQIMLKVYKFSRYTAVIRANQKRIYSYIQVSSILEYFNISESLKWILISFSADSDESLAWTTLRPVSRAKCPRIVPVGAV